jgi:hypothetical protein
MSEFWLLSPTHFDLHPLAMKSFPRPMDWSSVGGGTRVYRPSQAKFCRVEVNRSWGQLIGFGVRDCPASTTRDVNLFLTKPQTNGASVLEVVPVQCCAWCGEMVETCRTK